MSWLNEVGSLLGLVRLAGGIKDGPKRFLKPDVHICMPMHHVYMRVCDSMFGNNI